MTVETLHNILGQLIDKGQGDKIAIISEWDSEGHKLWYFSYPCRGQILSNDDHVIIGTYDRCIVNRVKEDFDPLICNRGDYIDLGGMLL